jgi:hypothetical protein
VLRVERTVRAAVTAPPDRCMTLLGDVEGYPRWARLLDGVEVTERDPLRVRVIADVLGLTVEMDCALELGPDRVVLRRLPNDADDDERYEAAWTISDGAVELQVTAAIDAPGPASLLRGRVTKRLADDLLADFVAAVD